MRNEFPGYFKPSVEQVDAIWKTGLVVFDANALLNLYRYTETTRADLMSAIRTFGDRVRIPYQVAYEFFQNRVTVISEQRKAYRDVLDAVDAAKKKILEAIAKHDRRHGLLDPGALKERLSVCLQPLIDEVSALQEKHPDFLNSDDFVLDELSNLVEGHVLKARSADDLTKDRKWAQARIEAGTPPGFKDKGKPDGGVGDALIWREIIELAKAENRPIIFVSDDQKEDWVLEVDGKKLGALPALRQELFKEAGQDFQLYNVQRFLAFVQQSAKQPVSDESIKEAASVRDHINELNNEVAAGKGALSLEMLRYLRRNNLPVSGQVGVIFPDFQRAENEVVELGHEIRRIERRLGQTRDQMEQRRLVSELDAAQQRREDVRGSMKNMERFALTLLGEKDSEE